MSMLEYDENERYIVTGNTSCKKKNTHTTHSRRVWTVTVTVTDDKMRQNMCTVIIIIIWLLVGSLLLLFWVVPTDIKNKILLTREERKGLGSLSLSLFPSSSCSCSFLCISFFLSFFPFLVTSTVLSKEDRTWYRK